MKSRELKAGDRVHVSGGWALGTILNIEQFARCTYYTVQVERTPDYPHTYEAGFTRNNLELCLNGLDRVLEDLPE
jgi:hypothetical protein